MHLKDTFKIKHLYSYLFYNHYKNVLADWYFENIKLRKISRSRCFENMGLVKKSKTICKANACDIGIREQLTDDQDQYSGQLFVKEPLDW